MDRRIIVETSSSLLIGSEPRCEDGSPIEELMLDFVKAKAARSQSQKTAKAYFETMTAFRTYLQGHGYDLIMYTRDEEGWTDYTFIRSKIADCASDFAIRSKKPGKTLVAESTRDQRLALPQAEPAAHAEKDESTSSFESLSEQIRALERSN